MIKKVTMKRFIYFFIFFLMLTLGLFFIMNTLGSRTLQQSLVNASKNQLSYVDSIMDGVISEASMYGIQYTADPSVRFYQDRIQELNIYDAQMKKNDISDRLSDQLLSSQAVDTLGIYWKSDRTFIYTGHNPQAKPLFEGVTERGWKNVGSSLYYFSVYPYIHQPTNPANIQYIVGVKLKTEYLTSLLEKAVNGDSSNAFFLLNNSLVLSMDDVNSSIEQKVKETVTPGTADIVKFDYHTGDDDYYVLSKYIEPIGMYLVTYTRMSDFLDPLNRNQQVFFASILVILLIGIIVIMMFYRNFYRNVHLLGKKFHQVEQGNYSTRISGNPANEFYNLFKSFNHMVSRTQALFTSLKIETELRRNAEVKQLQAQINPHFLSNSLFFIMSMAKSSPEAVMQMSKHLAEYYRYLTKLGAHDATLASELKLADHYLSIMALCKDIQYEINLPPELGQHRIMTLIIQPIVENAIQHGIEEQQGSHRISIDVKALDDGALILIADDGKGLSGEGIQALEARLGHEVPPEGTRGVGLWNINQRLKNAYGELSGLRFFTNDWGGLSVLAYIDFSLDEGGQHALTDRG
ncbi:sensor histidine kinase [Paenibacillus sp. PK3_47]|uniref:sensor histidine kinase n=1 Tax=Paenibacillus sp. PK3_47 TaxID=2072642 RepID=UPI00201E3C42|nr:histidine kinase [Paenibacillus sp. PK3_47]UQZ32637.1 sensor histidine kinase [Paenibacillus sp. PK3_47]